MDVKDLAGVSQPATKLIEVISAGMGKLYEPRATRKMAEAEAYAVKTLSQAKGEGAVFEAEAQALARVKYLEVLANGDPDLLQRARLRVLTREVEGQRNVESIAERALSHLPEVVSELPVSDDWRRKFFLEAENICDADLQLLWGKVLVGETESPGSYSVRTLDVLKNLSQQEAELFRKLCNIAFRDGWVLKLTSDINTALSEFGISYSVIAALRDAGLLHHADNMGQVFTAWPATVTSHMLENNGVIIQISGRPLRFQQFPQLVLTRAGAELQNLVPPTPCEAYLKAVGVFMRSKGFVVKRGTTTEIPERPGHKTLTFADDL